MKIEHFWQAECEILSPVLPFFYMDEIQTQLNAIHAVFYQLVGTDTLFLPSDTRVQVVKDYIEHAHRRVIRSGRPYAEHPIRLAAQYHALFPQDIDGVCGLLAHDVIEDCDVGLDYDADILSAILGPSLSLVHALTDEGTGSRKERVAHNVARLLKSSLQIRNMKVLDACDNIVSIALLDPGFFQTYIKEKKLFLDHTQCDERLRPYINICTDVSVAIFELHQENKKGHNYAFSV